jgi:hypothetical protein
MITSYTVLGGGRFVVVVDKVIPSFCVVDAIEEEEEVKEY